MCPAHQRHLSPATAHLGSWSGSARSAVSLRLQPDPTDPAGISLLAPSGQSRDAARHAVPVQRRSRPSEVEFSPHHSRLMTPPAGPSMSVGPGPPPVPPRRPQPSLAPPLRRLWSSAIASVVCNVYPRPRLVLHQRVRSSRPGPRRCPAAAPGAPPAPSRCQPRPAAGVVSMYPCRTLRTP